MLRRFLGELQEWFGIKLEIPDGADALRANFANALHMAAARGRLVLVIDALNQLDDRDGAPDLVWLPPGVPDNVRLILSTLPGRPLEALEKRNWPTLTIEPLTVDERRRLIQDYLRQYTKGLSDSRVERIAACQQAANPLFLRALLEELRVFGVHERLDERIDYYLRAATVDDLYERILERWEVDYEVEREGLVREAMSLLWAARRGLSEAELLDLLSRDGQPLPRARWSPLFLAAEQSLTSRGGLIGFFHDYLRQAVRNRYLSNETDRRNAHLRLADYFGACNTHSRSIEELPWQLCKARAWQRLYDVLTDLSFFEAGWASNPSDVKRYWTRLQENTQHRIVIAYKWMLDDETYHGSSIWDVATLLADMGHPRQALGLRKRLVVNSRQQQDSFGLQRALGNYALLLKALGELDEAMELFREQEEICRVIGNADVLQSSFGNQALILDIRGQFDRALDLLTKQEQLCRKLNSLDSLRVCLGNQAEIRRKRGELAEALQVRREQERICRELGNEEGLAICFGGQAAIYQAGGELRTAFRLLRDAERIFRELGNKRGLHNCIGDQGILLQRQNDLDGAMALHIAKAAICREISDQDGLSVALCNQAAIHFARDDLAVAMPLFKEEETISRELGNLDALATCLGNQAAILQAQGHDERALALHKEEERIYRNLSNQIGLAISLGNQALILGRQENPQKAVELLKQQERICLSVGQPRELAYSLINQASLLAFRLGQPKKALTLATEAATLASTHRIVDLAEQIAPILERIKRLA
jgi:nephrocystin-3